MMTIALLPDVSSYLQDVSPNIMIARCLIAAFIILAVGFGVNQIRHMRRRMKLLDEEMRAHTPEDRALNEALCGVAGHSGSKARRDPWAN